jgi:hypothetical protein
MFPFWKPDSRTIGFFAGGKLKAVPVREGGIPYDICDAPDGSAFMGGAAWNRNDVILFMSKEFRLQKVSAKGGAGSVPVTTLDPGETSHRWPSFLPDGQHFLYLALGRPGDPGELHVGSLDGAPPTSLGPSDSNALYSQGHLLSVRAGQLVARPFDAAARLPPQDPLTLAPARIEPGARGLGHFSAADSGFLAYRESSAASQQLTWRDRNGKVVGTVGERGRFSNLDLSPDGTRVAVSTRAVGSSNSSSVASDIWIADLRNGNSDRLTTDPGLEFDPIWSRPDGRTIAFISNRTRDRWSAFRRPSDGSAKDELLIPADSSVYPSDWAPDGLSILYTNDSEDVWVLPLGGARKRFALPRTPGRKESAIFSPNGRWIAYVSDKSGRREIYVRAFPSGEGEAKVSRDGGTAPRWRADGKEIFFLSLDSTLMAVRVETTNGVSVMPAESLFPTSLSLNNNNPYAVARDGRFLMPMAVDPRGTPPITVLVNWEANLPRQ